LFVPIKGELSLSLKE